MVNASVYSPRSRQINSQSITANESTPRKAVAGEAVSISHRGFTCFPLPLLAIRGSIVSLRANENNLTEFSFKLPPFRSLKKLTIRKNQIKSFGRLIENLSVSCPNLEDLSLEGNECWPRDESTQGLYREAAALMLKRLRYLNGVPTHRACRPSPKFNK
ncbi:unnamed protein product [Caenorhabditis auriculariae]|uniref:Uncharacterized protein n=1 Tax=Caenorhabditis auriculariae TaxID=2777116 RepID=A0A8S1GYC5_9PELO|nr:unnamed protein product [Caenorhabditis auriculariae]